MGLVPGATFDLCEDEFGATYDVLKAADRQRIRTRVARDQPFLVVGSPPCTDWCWYSAVVNHRRMPAAEVRRRLIERQVTLRFAVEIYCLQLAGGRHFLHEHRWALRRGGSGASWRWPGSQAWAPLWRTSASMASCPAGPTAAPCQPRRLRAS